MIFSTVVSGLRESAVHNPGRNCSIRLSSALKRSGLPWSGMPLYGYTYNGIPDHGSPDLFNALDSLMDQFRPGLCTALSLSPETTVEKIMIQAGMFSKNREEFEAKMREYAAIRLPWSMWPLFVDLELMRFQITGQD